jgi:putative intracellular protease/amidase/effector-binding domain-containing protein
MQRGNCYLFVFDGYSDWEPALAVYGINQFSDQEVFTFSIDGQPVTSGGNVHIQPDKALADVDPADVGLLILPGGGPMENGANTEIIPLVTSQIASGKPLAAICGATVFLASHGLLDQVKHTSNDLDLLKMLAPGYKAEALYVQAPSVADRHVITANGVSTVAFTRDIFQELGLLENEKLAFWFQFFLKEGGPKIESLPPFHFFYRSYRTNIAGLATLARTEAQELYRQAVAAGLELAGAPQWHYYDFNGDPDSDFTLEIGIPVAAPGAAPEPYACKTLPAFRCVSMQHSGSWETISATYEKLFAGIWMAGLKTSGHNREYYIQYDPDQCAVNNTLIQIGLS